MRLRALVLLVASLMLTGCGTYTTDKLAVFEGNVLTDNEMKPWLGTYHAEAESPQTENASVARLTLEKRGTRYHLRLTVKGKDETVEASGYFLLSHIPKDTNIKFGATEVRLPGSQNAVLFASPKLEGQKGDPVTNLFGLLRLDGGRLYVWVVNENDSVAKGQIKSENNAYPVEQVKKFLVEYADAFTLANDPVLTCTKL